MGTTHQGLPEQIPEIPENFREFVKIFGICEILFSGNFGFRGFSPNLGWFEGKENGSLGNKCSGIPGNTKYIYIWLQPYEGGRKFFGNYI